MAADRAVGTTRPGYGIGVEVQLADNGVQAVDMGRQARPDIVFMDIRMPEMDGEEAMRELTEDPGRDAVKVVAVSASTLEHERQHYLEAGFQEFIGKPVRVDQLYRCLAGLLGVEFEYAEAAAQPAGRAPVDLAGLALPAELHGRLRAAAEVANVTELRRVLVEVEELGQQEAQLAASLRERVSELDMDAVSKALGSVGTM